MTTPKSNAPKNTATPPPMQTPTDLSAASIESVGADLTRLFVAAIPLSLRAVNAIATNLPDILSRVTASLDSTAAPQGNSDLDKAASDFVRTIGGLHLGLVKASMHGLEVATRTGSNPTTELSTPTRK